MADISALVHATGTITSSGVQVTANDTVTIGGVEYTFVASPAVENDIDIGADAAATLQNLYDAINGSGVAGQYHADTEPNPDAIATSVTATVLTVKSRVPGTVGNFLPLAKSAATLSVSAALLASGAGSIATAIDEILAGSQLNAEVEQHLRVMDSDSANR
jgi:hypothetical protein